MALEDGSEVAGFVCEGYAAQEGVDATEFAGWRAYLDGAAGQPAQQLAAGALRRASGYLGPRSEPARATLTPATPVGAGDQGRAGAASGRFAAGRRCGRAAVRPFTTTSSDRAASCRHGYLPAITTPPLSLVEFPADDPERARRFWAGLLEVELDARADGEGRGWQTHTGSPEVGIHERGTGPGDRFSLPYFMVSDVAAALERVRALGGDVVHPGVRWAICRDSEGTPFGVASS